MLGFTRQDPVQPDERIQAQMQSEQQYWEEDPFGSSLPDDEPTAIPRPSFIHKVGRLIRKQIEDIGEYLILGSTVVMLGIAVVIFFVFVAVAYDICGLAFIECPQILLGSVHHFSSLGALTQGWPLALF